MERALLENFSTPLLAVDRQGRVRFANPAAAQFWNAQPERMEEFNLARLFGPDSAVMTRVRRAFEDEASATIDDYRFEQGEGLPALLLRVQIDPVLLPKAPLERVLVAFWDDTGRNRLAAAEQDGRLMDSIALMVRRLAHELQNPLSGIKGATQLLARQIKEPSELTEYAAVILRELERLERLVRSLLQQGGETQLHKARFNVHELLDAVIWFQSNARGSLEIVRDYDPSLPELEADRDRLHQVFLNLMRNAAEAGASQGPIVVRTHMLAPWQEREAAPAARGVYFAVEIEDQGAGVDAADVGKLFTPFFTTKKTGHGLGLAICYQIVRAHGGLLRYRPRRGGGSVFSVLLPLQD